MAIPPLIIPVFLPYLGCRKRCLFCNQKALAEGPPSPPSIRNFIEASPVQFPSDKTDREKQVAFYGGSFTAIPRNDQRHYLREVRPFIDSGEIDSVRISTRPDALDEEILSFLKEYRVKTVELGAQSMIDEVLFLSRRGHRAEDTASATQSLKRWGFEVGLQLMIGLPGDSPDRFLQTLDRAIDLRPDFLRIHPTLVLKGAPLETLWKSGRYAPMLLEEAVDWLKRGLLKLERSMIRVVRIGLQPAEELERDFLAGPFHPALHQLVDSAICFDMAGYLLRISRKNGQPLFFCHPKEVSNLRGQRNENILKLKDRFELKEIRIHGREDLPRGRLVLQTSISSVSLDRKDFYYNEDETFQNEKTKI